MNEVKMATPKQIIESRLFQMSKKIESLEKHVQGTQVYLDGLKLDYEATRDAWRAIRNELED